MPCSPGEQFVNLDVLLVQNKLHACHVDVVFSLYLVFNFTAISQYPLEVKCFTFQIRHLTFSEIASHFYHLTRACIASIVCFYTTNFHTFLSLRIVTTRFLLQSRYPTSSHQHRTSSSTSTYSRPMGTISLCDRALQIYDRDVATYRKSMVRA